MPAKAGIQYSVTSRSNISFAAYWIPAFAGMTAAAVACSRRRGMLSPQNDSVTYPFNAAMA